MSTVAPTPGRPRRRSSAVLLVAMLVVTSLGVAVLAPARPALAAPAWTTTDLNLREGPGTWYDVILVMPPGAYVEIVQNLQNGYYRVRYEGISGWAHSSYLDRNGGGDPGGGGGGSATVTEALNLRVGPSTADRVITVMPAGAAVTLTGDSANGYLSVNYNGTNGWAYSTWLDTDGGGSPDPDPGSGTGETATVTSGLNLRSSPWGSVITVMPAGATVELTGESSQGFLGVIYNGAAGWAYADYLDTSGGGDPGGGDPGGGGDPATVTTGLNLRAGPSTGDRVLTVMPGGATVEVTGGSQNGFYPVVYNGTSGWAYGDYLDFGGGGNPGGGGGSIIWPFSGGEWTIIQGYNGGTHNGGQYYYSLDLARTDGNTAGQTIYAPVSGTVLWNDVSSGGILIDMGNGYAQAMFHITVDAGVGRGDWVNQGQYLGYISYPGGRGYAVTPHVDMTLWDISGGGRVGAPYVGGNAIAGTELWETGGWNQHGGTLIYP